MPSSVVSCNFVNVSQNPADCKHFIQRTVGLFNQPFEGWRAFYVLGNI